MASMRGLWAVMLLGPAALLVGGSASAAGKSVSGQSLRPAQHIDGYGRTVEDVCPARDGTNRRCFAQRIVDTTRPRRPVPASHGGGGGGGGSDPNCQAQAGQGGSSPPSGTMTPTDVLTAYNIPSSAKANGKIVALMELPSIHALDDVNAYRAAFNIPALAACPTNSSGVPVPNGTACFARVGEDGTVNSVTTTDCPGWSGETGLDMDMVSAACPDCSIVLVEANTTGDLDAMQAIAATVVHAEVASNSWGGPEQQDDQSPYQQTGITILAASGDQGYLDEADGNGQAVGANFPASSVYVMAVGGTTLNKSGSSYSEVVWNDGAQGGAGGSGCSGEFATPSYQSTSGFSFGSCTERASVDVSAAAEFTPTQSSGGIAAYDADDNGWNAVVGTSAATPLWAAIMVRLGLGGSDQHALFYKNIAAFNDVTSGNNDNDNLCSDVMCTAGTGWDGPTGLGSPNGNKLLALAGGTPPPPPPVDAGSPSEDSGTPPIEDTGTGSQGGGDTGSGGFGGQDTGTGSSTSPGALGSSCSSASEAPPSGLNPAEVCTEPCTGFTGCLSGYTCQSGYCFPGSGSASTTPGSGSGSGAAETYGSSKSSGCAVSSSETESRSGDLAWLAVGAAVLVGRRRKRA